jgi:hypothetical protein
LEAAQTVISAATELNREFSSRSTTIEAFTVATGGSPWTPFTYDEGDPVSVEEDKVFDVMSQNYKRHVTPSNAVGYNRFERAWNEEAGRRLISSVRGDESIIAIRHKSTIQLQNHYDKVQQLRSASYVSANPTGEARAAALRMALRTTRGSAPAPPITQAIPRAYPQIDIQQIPTGVPMALNPNVAMVNVGRRESVQGRAPYSIRLQQNDVQIALPKPSFRAICK